MRHKMLKMGMLAGVLTAFAAGAFAQHEEHHPQYQPTQEYKTQAQVQPGQATPSSPSGMMRGGMMMGQNQQMSDSINKMIENMAAIQNEKDPAKMKAMMAQQNTMLEHMRNQMMQQDSAMQNMSGMMMKTCPMMGEDTKPSTK